MFLRDSWVSTLKAAMRSSLRDMSKGWYNLYETNREVYLMSKLRKLMELLKYVLQDTLRFLVQDSLASFSQFISDACRSVLDCPDDMVWGHDLINSPYRWGWPSAVAGGHPHRSLPGWHRWGERGSRDQRAQHYQVLDGRESPAPALVAWECPASSDSHVSG